MLINKLKNFTLLIAVLPLSIVSCASAENFTRPNKSCLLDNSSKFECINLIKECILSSEKSSSGKCGDNSCSLSENTDHSLYSFFMNKDLSLRSDEDWKVGDDGSRTLSLVIGGKGRIVEAEIHSYSKKCEISFYEIAD